MKQSSQHIPGVVNMKTIRSSALQLSHHSCCTKAAFKWMIAEPSQQQEQLKCNWHQTFQDNVITWALKCMVKDTHSMQEEQCSCKPLTISPAKKDLHTPWTLFLLTILELQQVLHTSLAQSITSENWQILSSLSFAK